MGLKDLQQINLVQALAGALLALLVWNAKELNSRIKAVERNQVAIMVHMGMLPDGHRCDSHAGMSGVLVGKAGADQETMESAAVKVP